MTVSSDLPFASASSSGGLGQAGISLRRGSGGGTVTSFTAAPSIATSPQNGPVFSGSIGWEQDDASPVVQAHRYSLLAEDAYRRGDLADATNRHLSAAKAFLQAAEQIQEHGVLASSLLLLADSHAAQAEEATIRARLSSDAPLLPGGASRGLTPAAAYRASVTGADRSSGGSAAAGAGGGGGVGAGGSSRLGPGAFNVGDMDDSIMRGPGQQKDDYAAELARKFRPQMDDLLELERQLSKLGLESRAGRAGGAGGRAKSRLRLGGNAAGGNPGAHLSSALGESFCLLNQSVIFGGGIAGGGLTAAAGSVPLPAGNSNGAHNVPVSAKNSASVDGDRMESRGPGEGPGETTYAPSHPRPPPSPGSTVNLPQPRDNGEGTTSSTAAAQSSSSSQYEPTVSSREGGVIRGTRSGDNMPAPPGGRSGGDGERRYEDALRSSGGREAEEERRDVSGRVEGWLGTKREFIGRRSGLSWRGDASGTDRDRQRKQQQHQQQQVVDQEMQQGEIMRLLTCLKTLGDENLSLMKECEDRDRVRQESEAVREEMRRFQLKYKERFGLLKKTLDEVVSTYPRLSAPGAGTGSGGGASTGAGGPRAPEDAEREIQRLSQSNRKLSAQVKKYEKYYLELCQKADTKRKDQLAQAKAARQQQLAHHHPSLSGLATAQQQPQQQQQQQQQHQMVQKGGHQQRRSSPGPGTLRPQAQRPSQPAQQQQIAQSQQHQQQRPTQHPQQPGIVGIGQQPQRRPSPAPTPHSQQGGTSNLQQAYPSISQQHLRQHHAHLQHQQQQQQQMGSQGLPVYRASVQQAVVSGIGIGSGLARGGMGSGGAGVQAGMVDRSAGLDQESDV